MFVRFVFLFAAGVALAASADAAPIQAMTCRATTATVIDRNTLQATRMESTDLYRFGGGSLFIRHGSDAEYLYGHLKEVEPRRYTVGFMTILIDERDGTRLLVIHADKTSPKVVALQCNSRP